MWVRASWRASELLGAQHRYQQVDEAQHDEQREHDGGHGRPQNRTMNANVRRFSSLSRSGVNPGTICVGSPVLPPAGVMPPSPVKYGTLAWRWLNSARNVTFGVGM